MVHLLDDLPEPSDLEGWKKAIRRATSRLRSREREVKREGEEGNLSIISHKAHKSAVFLPVVDVDFGNTTDKKAEFRL